MHSITSQVNIQNTGVETNSKLRAKKGGSCLVRKVASAYCLLIVFGRYLASQFTDQAIPHTCVPNTANLCAVDEHPSCDS